MKFAETLWELLGLRAGADRRVRRPSSHAPRPPRSAAMQARYDDLVAEMKDTWNIRIHRWRKSTSVCAWQLRAPDGTITRMIEAPYPRGPMSCVVFLHEVGHHAIGFGRYRPRCLEEQKAWLWAMDAMRSRDLNVTKAVERRYEQAMRYAVAKAQRRGLKTMPASLVEYALQGTQFGSSDAPN